MKALRKRLTSAVLSILVAFSGMAAAFPAYAADPPELVLNPSDVSESSGLSVGEIIGDTSPGSWVKYAGVDFGEGGFNKIEINAGTGSNEAGNAVRICLDQNYPQGELIAELKGPDMTPDWQLYAYDRELPGDITGVHDVYVQFSNWGAANLQDIRFFFRDDSGVAELSSLTADGYSMNEPFSAEQETYSVWVAPDAETVSVTARATVNTASVNVNGTVQPFGGTFPLVLSGDQTNAEVTVISQNGEVRKTYTVSFLRRTDDVTDAGTTVQAAQAGAHSGILLSESGAEGFADGAQLRYDGVAFAEGYNVLALSGTETGGAGSVELWIDGASAKDGGTLLSSLDASGVFEALADGVSLLEREITGTHNVFLVFRGESPLASLASFSLEARDLPSADLSGITIGNGLSLDRAFRYNETDYTVYVPDVFTEISVFAEAYKPGKAAIVIDGQSCEGEPVGIEVLGDGQEVEILVTSTEDDTVSQTYTLTLTRTPQPKTFYMDTADILKSENDTWEMGWVNPGDWALFRGVDLSGYNTIAMDMSICKDSAVIEYWIDCDLSGGSPTGGTRIAVFDKLGTGLSFENPANLQNETRLLQVPAFGLHDIYIKVNADGFGMGALTSFTLSCDPDTKGTSAMLGELSAGTGTLNPAFHPETESYTLTVDSSVESVSLYAPAADRYRAKTSLNGVEYNGLEQQTAALTGNRTELTITVTSEDGQNTKEYRVMVQRRLPGDPKDIYVALDGDDEQNSGLSADSPLKTLSYALACASEGTTVHLAEGKYIFSEQSLWIPSGVTLQGAGMGKTVLESQILPREDAAERSGEGYLLRIENAENVTVCDMTLKGCIADESFTGNDPTNAQDGIYVSGCDNVTVARVEFDWFNHSGVFLGDSTNSRVADCKLWNCGMPDNSSCSGAIELYNLTDCEIYGNRIRENRGGYGIKGYPVGFSYENMKWSKLTRVKIYNNDIDLRQLGGWAESAGVTNMAIELWRTSADEVEIFNNRIRECVSLIGDEAEDVDTFAFRVYNNYFTAKPWGTKGGYAYFIESSFNKSEIFHNYFEYGIYPMASWGGDHRDNSIYDNVFDKTEAFCYLSESGAIENYSFDNNIFHLTDQLLATIETDPDRFSSQLHNFPLCNALGAKDLSITGNIFVAEESVKNDGDGAVLFNGADNGVTAADNIFCNWKLSGDNALEADPQLNPNDFRLAYGSPALAHGFEAIDLSDVGLTAGYLYPEEGEAIAHTFLMNRGAEPGASILDLDGSSTVQLFVRGRTTSGYLVEDIPASYTVNNLEGRNVVSVSSDGLVTAKHDGIAVVSSRVKTDNGDLVSSVTIRVTGLGSAPSSSTSDPTPGSPLPSAGDGTPAPTGGSFVSDTTQDLTVSGAYQFRITSTDGSKPVMTADGDAFRVELASREGNDWFYRITAQGAPGDQAKILVNGKVLLTAAVAGSEVISDTTHPFAVAPNGTYQFRLTADTRPVFAAGSPSFTVEYAGNQGRDWFFKVHAVGKPGDGCGFYINGASAPVAVAHIA